MPVPPVAVLKLLASSSESPGSASWPAQLCMRLEGFAVVARALAMAAANELRKDRGSAGSDMMLGCISVGLSAGPGEGVDAPPPVASRASRASVVGWCFAATWLWLVSDVHVRGRGEGGGLRSRAIGWVSGRRLVTRGDEAAERFLRGEREPDGGANGGLWATRIGTGRAIGAVESSLVGRSERPCRVTMPFCACWRVRWVVRCVGIRS